MITSSSAFPGTAVFEMMDAGFPQNMLVIGKPAGPKDADNGYISPTNLTECVNQAKQKGWNAGVMTWEVGSFLLQYLRFIG